MIAWIMENYMGVFGAWLGLLAAAQGIVLLTPTEKDDRFLAKLGAWTQKLRNLLMLGGASRDQ